jgi:hypothetical protein
MNRPARLLLFVVLFAGCNEDLLNPMADRQARVNNYSESEFYDDKLAMREPPAGTVPRERFVRNEAFTTGKRTSSSGEATYVTTFPLRVDRPLLELGRKRFDITCATCHGPVGDGDSIVARQMALRPPPSLHNYSNRPPGYIFEVVTKGFGLMASYAAEIPVRERWAVVAYVRALQISQASSLDMAPPEERTRLSSSPAQPDESGPPPVKENL